VTATDREGTELGQGKAVFSVTVDEKTLEDATKRADAAKKFDEGLAAWARGEGVEAVALLREAHALDPENMAAAANSPGAARLRGSTARCSAPGRTGMLSPRKGRIEEALDRYEQAASSCQIPKQDKKNRGD
jgi:tetratricopeptide (TPR) repeat protein